MTVLAFDFGLKNIGVATVEPRAGTANGLARVAARDGRPHWEALDRLVGQWQPESVVVGLPLNMDGTESEMCSRARGFGRRLTQRYGVEVTFTDERLSTFEARSEGLGADESHAVAARLIGETWLRSRDA